MDRYWVGDFRLNPLKTFYELDNEAEVTHNYIIEDFATQTWLETEAAAKLEAATPVSSNIIIMIGLRDCINSCYHSKLDIKNIAADTIASLEVLKSNHQGCNLYFCAVPPVEGDYSEVAGSLSAAALNSKIEKYNAEIKAGCPITFLDCYNHLKDTDFATVDGIHYTCETSKALESFIIHNLKETSTVLFTPRLSAPVIDAYDDVYDPIEDYWILDECGGESPFPQPSNSTGGSALPNCTAYAWGRFYEIIGERPKLSVSNAENWWGYTADGYKRGQEPALGAVICWRKGAAGNGNDGAGHVGIVEQINPDGTIVTSESGWENTTKWWLQTRSNSDGNWGASSSYTFQGFIYCPLKEAVDTSALCTKNSYGITVEEMKPNAQYIWQYFSQRGWTLNAVAGMLGNIQQESKFSPCVWEGTIKGSNIDANGKHSLNTSALSGFKGGYGLTQWTPYTKYITWCNDGGTKGNANGTGGVLSYWEMDTQLKRIEAEVAISTKSWVEGLSQWIKKPNKGYDLTFNQFITSTESAEWLAGAFAFCYERPARSTGTEAEQAALKKERGEYAKFWYDYLSGVGGAVTFSNETGLSVNDIRIDTIKATKIKISFLAKNGASGKALVYQGNSQKKRKDLTVEDGLNTFEISGLVPNTSYTLKIEVKGTDDKEIKDSINFVTPQDYPEAVKQVSFTPNKQNDLKGTCTLTITKPSYLGYYSNNSGYDIILYINGVSHSSVEYATATNVSRTNLTLKNFFSYEHKLADVVQIGVYTWVKNGNTKIYNQNGPIVSAPVHALTSSVTTYLNVE